MPVGRARGCIEARRAGLRAMLPFVCSASGPLTNCEHIEKAVLGNWQKVILQLSKWAESNNFSPYNIIMAQNISQSLRLWRVFQHDINIGKWIWNVRSLCRTGSLTIVARELVVCKLHLVGVQVARSDRSGTERAGDCIIFYSNGNENCESGTGFLLSCVGFEFPQRCLWRTLSSEM
jgi:hypothetical protein